MRIGWSETQGQRVVEEDLLEDEADLPEVACVLLQWDNAGVAASEVTSPAYPPRRLGGGGGSQGALAHELPCNGTAHAQPPVRTRVA
jgi:hypothetical protein